MKTKHLLIVTVGFAPVFIWMSSDHFSDSSLPALSSSREINSAPAAVVPTADFPPLPAFVTPRLAPPPSTATQAPRPATGRPARVFTGIDARSEVRSRPRDILTVSDHRLDSPPSAGESRQPARTAGANSPAPVLDENAVPSQRLNSSAGPATALEEGIAVVRPAVLLPPEPGIALTEPQVTEWQQMQDDFVKAVGGPDQNPDDAAYRERWFSAQALSDQLFRIKFGTQAYLLQSVAALRASRSE